jgi:hypothetical protein
MSLASLALYVGIGVGPLLGEVAIERSGFGAAWALAGAAGLAAVAVAVLVPDTRPDDSASEPGGPAAGRLLIHRAGLLPGLVLLAGILGMAGFLTFVPLYALDLGMGGSRVVLLLFAAVVVGIRGVGARIPDRLGPAGRPGSPWPCRRPGWRWSAPGGRPPGWWPGRRSSPPASPCSPPRS